MHTSLSDTANTSGHLKPRKRAYSAMLAAERKWALLTEPSPSDTNDTNELGHAASSVGAPANGILRSPWTSWPPSALPIAGPACDARVLVMGESKAPPPIRQCMPWLTGASAA